MQYNMILENVDNLPLKMQIRLVDVIKKRIIEKKRELILKSAETSLNEYNSGNLSEETADELIQRLSGNHR
jgi:hypothetical protein